MELYVEVYFCNNLLVHNLYQAKVEGNSVNSFVKGNYEQTHEL